MKLKKTAAVIAAAGALTFLAACGDDSTAGTTQSAAPSTALPDGFPSDVPVVGTMFKPYDTPVEDAVGMEVVGATAASFDQAVRKLRDAKYDEVLLSATDPTLKTANFSNDKYTVGVVGTETGGHYRLNYSVIVVADAGGE